MSSEEEEQEQKQIAQTPITGGEAPDTRPQVLPTPPQHLPVPGATGTRRVRPHINYHSQQMAAITAAVGLASRSQREAPGPAPKRLRLTPSPGPQAEAGSSTSQLASIAPETLYPVPVEALSQLSDIVTDSTHTHAVVSLELLRLLDWRARRSFLVEREEQRAALQRSTRSAFGETARVLRCSENAASGERG